MENNQYPLKDAFIEFCKTGVKYKGKTIKKIDPKSAERYADEYLPDLRKYLYKTKSYPLEKHFLEVVPFLLSQKEYDKCTQLLLRVYRIVQIKAYSDGKPYANYRSAFNKYALFIQSNYIDKPNKVTLPYTLTQQCISNLLSYIRDELKNGIVYYYFKHKSIIPANGLKLSVNKKNKYNLWGILNSRLGSQNRTSGEKIWFSMDLLRKFKVKVNNKEETASHFYIRTINENIYIHAVDNNGNKKSIKCGGVWCIYLYKIAGQTDYYVKVTDKKFNTYQVETPTSTLGNRTLMQVADISKVAIDHVKPIDQSLRDRAGNISGLVMLSEAYKNAKSQLILKNESKPKDSEIVKEAITILTNNSTISGIQKKLLQELISLLKDSWYRLMDSKQNSAKGNDNMFSEFLTNNASNPSLSTTIGLMMKAKHSTNGTDMWVYQELSNPGTNYVNDATIVNSTYPTQIDLTSFDSIWGPEIL